MKPLGQVVLLAVGLTALGCQVSKQDAELLERDLRVQEDEIYALRDCVDTYQQKLAACRSENRALRKELAARGGLADDFVIPGGPPVELAPAQQLPPGDQPPPSAESEPPLESAPGRLPEAPPFQSPAIAPPSETQPEGVPLESIPPEESLPAERPPAEEVPAQSSSKPSSSGTELAQYTAPRSRNLLERIGRPATEQEVVDPVHDLEVTEITLNNMLTGGMNRDKLHGDEGILVVVEPRNPQNQIVEAFGDVSVVVLDPALEGEAARVARWDITSQELEHHFRNRQFGKGFQLRLPWPGDPPQHSTLHLFVRFVAADGRKLIVDRPLEIEPPGGTKPGGWVPATRSDVVADEQGPKLLPAPEARTASDSPSRLGAVREAAGSVPKADRPRDTAGGDTSGSDSIQRRTEALSAGDSSATRSPAKLAGRPKEELNPTGTKQRPKWAPYR